MTYHSDVHDCYSEPQMVRYLMEAENLGEKEATYLADHVDAKILLGPRTKRIGLLQRAFIMAIWDRRKKRSIFPHPSLTVFSRVPLCTYLLMCGSLT